MARRIGVGEVAGGVRDRGDPDLDRGGEGDGGASGCVGGRVGIGWGLGFGEVAL